MKKIPIGAIPLTGGLLVIIIAVIIVFSLFSNQLKDSLVTRQPNYETSDPLITKVINGQEISQPSISSNDPRLGPQDSAVTFVVFSDFACPYCKVIASQLRQLVSNNDDVSIVWKDYPITSLHPDSGNAHIAARCAAEQGKFWEFHDQLFLKQSNFTRTAMQSIANDLNLNTVSFNRCLDSTEPIEYIATNIEEGNALNIDGTPYLFINDQRISGLVTQQELEQLVALHSLSTN
jgi:protein-disulfide isomerase